MKERAKTEQVECALRGPFFAGLSDDALASLAAHAQCGTYRAGEFLFRHDEPAEAFFVLTEGKVALELSTPTGPHVIQTLGGGDVIGFSWLVPPHFWKFDGHCVEDANAVAIDGEELRDQCEADPLLGYEILKRFTGLMAQRLQATRYQLIDVYG